MNLWRPKLDWIARFGKGLFGPKPTATTASEKERRRRRPDVIDWQPSPGNPLPDPVILDDREFYPPAVVKNVLAMLNRERPRFHYMEPSHTLIQLYRSGEQLEAIGKAKHFYGHGFLHVPPAQLARVDHAVGETIIAHEEGANWKPCTVELNLQNRRYGLIKASYRYLAAKNEAGDCIVGPKLGVLRRA